MYANLPGSATLKYKKLMSTAKPKWRFELIKSKSGVTLECEVLFKNVMMKRQ
jgi:hypothetical protein